MQISYYSLILGNCLYLRFIYPFIKSALQWAQSIPANYFNKVFEHIANLDSISLILDSNLLENSIIDPKTYSLEFNLGLILE
jgi:hypothetical protein